MGVRLRGGFQAPLACPLAGLWHPAIQPCMNQKSFRKNSRPAPHKRPFGRPAKDGGEPEGQFSGAKGPSAGPGGDKKSAGRHGAKSAGSKGSGNWLYGHHAVRAALTNPARRLHRLVVTERAAEELGQKLLQKVSFEVGTMDVIARLLPPGSVHQGIALLCEKLPQRSFDEVLPEDRGRRRVVLVLDQITDPHNMGAILRSAQAFGVDMVVVQDRNAPPESGVLAKAASGALDMVPIATVVNIARTLDQLAEEGFWRVALAGDGEKALREAAQEGDVALVLGSEGSGVRRLVRERCDCSAFIPMAKTAESLNVSNAAAVALYEMRR